MAYDDNPFRKKDRRDVLTRRKNLYRDIGDTPNTGAAREAEIHLRYLRKQMAWQRGEVAKNQFSTEQHKRLFNEAFRTSWESFSPEQQSSLRTILGASRFAQAEASELTNSGLSPKGSPSKLAELMHDALAGRGGLPENTSNLLFRLMASHHRAIRPFAHHMKTFDGELAGILKVGDWLDLNDFRQKSKFFPSIKALNDTAYFKNLDFQNDPHAHLKQQMYQFQQAIDAMKGNPKTAGRLLPLDLSLVRSQHGSKPAQFRGQFTYQGKQIDFFVPLIEEVKSSIPGINKQIGYTGRNLDVRRVYMPYLVMPQEGMYEGAKTLKANEYFMKRVLEEILPKMQAGTISGTQAQKAFAQLKDILHEGETYLGNQFRISPAQANFEAFRGAGMILVQGTGGMAGTNLATGITPLYQTLNAEQVADFLKHNKWAGADVGPGKLGKGVISTVDYGKLHGLSEDFIEHKRLDQAIRRTTPAKEAVFAAYRDLTGRERGIQYKNLEKQQSFIRGTLAMNIVTETKDHFLPGGKHGPSFISMQEKSFYTGNKKQSVLRQGEMSSYQNLKDRTKHQYYRMEKLALRLADHSSPFQVTVEDIDNILDMAARKNLQLWEVEKLHTQAYNRSLETGRDANRLFVTSLFKATQRVSGGRVRRLGLSTATSAERSIFGFTPEKLPEFIGTAAESIDSIENPATLSRVHRIMRAAKKGKSLEHLRKKGFSETELTYAYHQIVGKKKGAAAAVFKDFTPVGLRASGLNKGSDALSKMQQLLSQNEGIIHAGAYYIDRNKLGAFSDEIPFGSGGGIFAPQMKQMTSVEVGGSLKMSRVEAQNLLTMADDGTIKFNEALIREKGKIFLGLDQNLKPRYITKSMLNEEAYRNAKFHLIGDPKNPQLQIDFTELRRPEELIKLHGDVKIGGVFLDSNRAFDDVTERIASAFSGSAGAQGLSQNIAAKTLRRRRFQADMITFSEHFQSYKKPQMHNRQMLTALQQHQFAYMQAMSSDLHMANKKAIGNLAIQEPAWRGSVAGLLTSGKREQLLSNAEQFRIDIQTGRKTGKEFSSFLKSRQDTKAYLARGGKAEGIGHRYGTKKFMEFFFKTGIDIESKMPSTLLFDESKRYLTHQNFADIFGLVGTHFGDAESDQMLREIMQVEHHGATIGSHLTRLGYTPGAYSYAAKSGAAAGLFRVALGDPMSQQGAGKMATWEPRLMNILDSSTFGMHGDEVAEDILKRIRQHDISPAGEGKLGVHQETDKMLRSLVGKMKPTQGDMVYTADMAQGNVGEVMDNLFRMGREILESGSSSDLFLKIGDTTAYIPPVNMTGMEQHTLEDGFRTQAQLASHIRSFIGDSFDIGPQNAREQFIEAISGDWAQEGKGMGAWLRNRVPGSFFLTAGKVPVGKFKGSKGVHAMDDLATMKITEPYVKQMLAQLERTGLYDEAGIESMRSRLYKGERVAGLAFRHPGIGPYSIQKTWFQMIGGEQYNKKTKKTEWVPDTKANRGPAIYVADSDVILRDLTIFDDLAENTQQGIRKTMSARIQLGPMVGFAGDFDFDQIGAMLLDPKLEKKIGRELQTTNYTQRHIEHQIRFQLLSEAKGYAGDRKETIRGVAENVKEAQRLAVANHHIGKISSLMTTAKRAALSYAPSKDLANIMALTEWIEQKPIGFKHVDPGTLKGQLELLNKGFASGHLSELQAGIRGFVGSDADILGREMTLSERDAKAVSQKTGRTFKRTIQGFDLDRTIEMLSKSILKARAENLPLDSNVHRGRSAAAAVEKEVLRMATESSTGGAVGRAVVNAEQLFSNVMGAAGEGVINHHKGIKALAAVGGLAALASFNSQPREMIGPGKQLNADVKIKMNNSKSAKRITPDSVRPTRAPVGSPISPNLLSQRRSMVAGNPVPSNDFVVRARANHPDDIGAISQQLQQFASASGGMSITNTERGIGNIYGDINSSY